MGDHKKKCPSFIYLFNNLKHLTRDVFIDITQSETHPRLMAWTLYCINVVLLYWKHKLWYIPFHYILKHFIKKNKTCVSLFNVGSKLLKELKKLDDKVLLVEVQLLESKVYQELSNIPKSRYVLQLSCKFYDDVFVQKPHITYLLHGPHKKYHLYLTTENVQNLMVKYRS